MLIQSVVRVTKNQNTTKECSTCAKAPYFTLLCGVVSTAELRHRAYCPGRVAVEGSRASLQSRGSQDLQSPPLGQFPLIKCVEDHLALVILVAT